MKWIIGIDEVGRGCVSGPVMVGVFAVLQDDAHLLDHEWVKDSKVVSAARRTMAYEYLDDVARGGNARYAVAMQSAEVIDKVGIVGAIRLCITEGLAAVGLAASDAHVYLDGGLHAPTEWKSQSTHIKGDRDHPVISAASIIAKVVRDEYMVELSKQYPEYHWQQNKGYGTLTHRNAIREYGVTDEHRKYFLKKFGPPPRF